MTELAPVEVEAPTYSKDYWDNVFEQIGKRPLVKLALAVLALLYGLAIYAPLIANDRPYLLEATDEAGYNKARRGLVGVTNSIRDLTQEGPEAHEERAAGAEAALRPYDEALAAEERALAIRLDEMRRYLPEELHGPLDAYQSEVAATAATAASGADVAEQPSELVATARQLRKDYEVADPDEPDAGGVTLVPARSYPLFEATTAPEVFFGILWIFVLAWPVWNRLVNRELLRGDRDRIRRARRIKFAAAFGCSAVAAGLWWLLVGGALTFETAPFKEGLTRGTITADRAVFPPITLGFAETHMVEDYRPPTWTEDSELDEEGFYVRGARVPIQDPVTGHVPESQPVEVRYGELERNSRWRHPLGTDALGRDLLVRILYGGRISLSVGFVSTFVLVIIGVVIGCIAGYFGGTIDILFSRLIEIVQSIPAFFLILTAVALVPEDQMNPIFTIVLMIGFIRWTGVARLVRGEFLKLKEQEFVVAAQALGLRPARVIFRHVLPNAMGPVLVAAAFSIAAGILTESAISFLGFGVKEPIPSWGSLLNESRAPEHWWIQVFPGLLIFLTVFCYNLVGEGIRDALDPHMKV